MERIADNIAKKVSLELGLDNNRKEVIAYGTFTLLHTILCIILVVIFGLIFGVLLEALIITFAISILRKYSGGAHTSSPGICAAAGTIITMVQALLICFVFNLFINLSLTILLGLISFIWSYYIIIKLAPVDSPGKPIRTQKKRKRMRKGSILVLTAYLTIVLLSIVIFLLTQEKRFLIFSLCIYGGTVWQAFTLTHGGHVTFRVLDSFFSQLLTLSGRRE